MRAVLVAPSVFVFFERVLQVARTRFARVQKKVFDLLTVDVRLQHPGIQPNTNNVTAPGLVRIPESPRWVVAE